jgi:hypothetical protein
MTQEDQKLLLHMLGKVANLSDVCIVLDPKWASHGRAISQFRLRIKSHPAPRHRPQVALRSAPMRCRRDTLSNQNR